MGRWAWVPSPWPLPRLSLLLLLLLASLRAQPQAGKNHTEPPESNATVTAGAPTISVTSVAHMPPTVSTPEAEEPRGGGLTSALRVAPSSSSPGGPVLTEDGQPCRFPFRYGGRMLHSCTSEGSAHRKWCATTHNYDRDRAWGYCAQTSASQQGPAALDPCASSPCLNGGSCTNTQEPASYHCTCPVAFTGKDCSLGEAALCNSAATLCPSRTPTPQADLWPLSCPVLIRLKKKGDRCAVRSQFVQPICLPEPSSPFPAGHKCQIAGWGHQDENVSGYSSSLREALVPLVADHKCSSPEVYGADISPNMLCAGYFDCKTDACQGDSGGPLACEKNGVAYLYGIISWGDGCGRLNKPGVYTRVANYVDWINDRIRPPKRPVHPS
nr:PREDICTED: hepatocyte growth factor activator [Rhinolophus sinicus]